MERVSGDVCGVGCGEKGIWNGHAAGSVSRCGCDGKRCGWAKGFRVGLGKWDGLGVGFVNTVLLWMDTWCCEKYCIAREGLAVLVRVVISWTYTAGEGHHQHRPRIRLRQFGSFKARYASCSRNTLMCHMYALSLNASRTKSRAGTPNPTTNACEIMS
jgi:hypothetical protein